MIAPAGHHCNVRSGHLNATFGGKDMGSMAQTGLLLVASDALGHTWALPGALGGGLGFPPQLARGTLNTRKYLFAVRCALVYERLRREPWRPCGDGERLITRG